ncbi:hypothetical protein MRX96_025382 [Rhipicephalus microplus]
MPITCVPTSDDIRLHDDAVALDDGPLSGAGAGKEQRDHGQDESFAPHGHSSLTSAGQTDWATEASAPFNRFPFRPARRQEGRFHFFGRFSLDFLLAGRKTKEDAPPRLFSPGPDAPLAYTAADVTYYPHRGLLPTSRQPLLAERSRLPAAL